MLGRPRSILKARFLPLLLLVIIGAAVARESHGKSKPAARKRSGPSTAALDFESCRKETLQLPKPQRAAAVKQCNEAYPGSQAYIDCKKSAFKTFQGKGKKLLEREMESCKKLLTSLSFDPKDPKPFAMMQGKAYFAGISLHRKIKAKKIAVQNFSCDELRLALDEPSAAEYLLFGNLPQLFSGFKSESSKELLAKFAKDWQKHDKDWLIPQLGVMAAGATSKLGPLYFPAGRCDFAPDTGEFLSGMSLYFLLDAKNAELTPYFGIAFYNEAQAIKGRAQAQKMKELLGESYKILKNKGGVFFITSAELLEYDDEGDPMNICRAPRKHSLIGIVKPGPQDLAEYAIIANVTNLCRFGDELTIGY